MEKETRDLLTVPFLSLQPQRPPAGKLEKAMEDVAPVELRYEPDSPSPTFGFAPFSL